MDMLVIKAVPLDVKYFPKHKAKIKLDKGEKIKTKYIF
jgi:hypothetical protein